MTSGSLLEMSTSRSHPRPTKSQFTFEYYIQVINVHIKILEAPNNLFWQDVSFCEAILPDLLSETYLEILTLFIPNYFSYTSATTSSTHVLDF